MGTIDIQRACDAGAFLPDDHDLTRWANAALGEQRAGAELSIRLVDEEESRELNSRYRDRDKPTNVLSFPADLPEELGLPLLGDLVICTQVVNREAGEQGKSAGAHWAHMVVHGTLHLLGYDHIDEHDAEIMESLETRILADLGYPPPYEDARGTDTQNGETTQNV